MNMFSSAPKYREKERNEQTQDGIDYLYRTYDRDYVDRILTGNAGRLLCRNHHSVPN